MDLKTKLIGELLVKYIETKILKYDNYFKEIDSDIVSDEEMYIFIDRWKEDECDDVYGNPISTEAYKEYLKQFKEKCDEFLEMLERELPKELIFTEYYFVITDEDYGDETFYNYCELHFRIDK